MTSSTRNWIDGIVGAALIAGLLIAMCVGMP